MAGILKVNKQLTGREQKEGYNYISLLVKSNYLVMKNIFLILLISFFALSTQVKAISNDNCTIEIASDVLLVDGANINPGDVVCLLAGEKDYLLLRDIQGTEAQPITVINKEGAVIIDTDHFYGIKFDNCKHIIFSGAGEVGLEYGIQIKRVENGAGMSIDNMSTNIEVEFVEVSNTYFAGIYAKTEPYQGDCNNLITRDVFTMYNLSIHDCYLHDIADEGFYIGSSKYTGQTITQCNDIVVLPHVIEGVYIHDNTIERTGWDGIQVSSSPIDCNIFKNLIRYDSEEEEYGQMSGILIGGGSKCDCYNNKIFEGKGDGIDIFGMGFMKIYNNLIVRAGRTYEPGNPTSFRSGIYVGYVPDALSPNATFKIYNNTIISPKSFGITFNNNEATMSYAINNLITEPGYINVIADEAYVNLMIDNSKVTQTNNFLSPNNSIPKFVNYTNNDFDLEPNSEAVNYGTSLTAEGITFDIENRFRPFHTYFDAGAYECHDPEAYIKEDVNIIGNPYPIPAKKYLTIPINNAIVGDVEISFFSLKGIVILQQVFAKNQITDRKINVFLQDIPAGGYILSIKMDKQIINKPIVIFD